MADKNHIFSHLSLSTTDRSPSFCLIVVFFHLPEVVFTSIPERLWWRGISVLAICDGQVEYALQKQDPFSSQLMQFCVLNLLSSTLLLKLNGTDYEVWRNMSSWIPNIQDASNQPWFNPRQTLEAKKVEFQTATQIAEATCDLFLLHLRPAATSSSILKNVMEIIGWYKCGSSIGFSKGYFSICSIHPGHLLCWIVKHDVVRRKPTLLSRRLCGSILVVNINN